MNYMEKYNSWLSNPNLDSRSKEILTNLSDQEKNEYFHKDASFGTAGIRGVVRPGSNAINIYNIRRANTGFAKYLAANTNAKEVGVAIAYDNRNMSKEFAQECATVFADNGIKTFMFDSLRPTPELSFIVRDMKLAGGVVVTASHNPPEYNGYKIYDENGCQFTPWAIKPIIEEINKQDEGLNIKVSAFEDIKNMITILGKETDQKYIDAVLKLRLNRDQENKVTVLYSPQHGTGITIMKDLLEQAKINADMFEPQCNVDPNFSNTKSPNPEDMKSYEAMIDFSDGDHELLVASDPDADRMGVCVYVDGEYKLISGNQTAAILMEYMLSQMNEKNIMPENPVMINTIVTSELGDIVAAKYNVANVKTLTGFKFVGDKIAEYIKTKQYNYVFGYEESFGYLLSPITRDKDAFQGTLMLLEAANFFKAKGKSLWDVMQDIYMEHGFYEEFTEAIVLKGSEGQDKIDSFIKDTNDKGLGDFKEFGINKIENFKKLITLTDNGEEKIDLPATDAFKFYFDYGWIAIRPSGTEPKLKVYYCVKGKNKDQAMENYNKSKSIVQNWFKSYNISY